MNLHSEAPMEIQELIHALIYTHSPCYVCWDLPLSQVAHSQCHDNHLRWHSGEQSSGPVTISRVQMNKTEHVLQAKYMCIHA